jgi:small subunit ribosomal protein S10
MKIMMQVLMKMMIQPHAFVKTILYKKVFKPILNISYMPKVRIKLNSTDIEMLNNICETVRNIAKKSGITISGPVPLPTKKLKVTTRKSPCGDGTATFDRFEMRIHKRLIDLPANEKVLHHIMKLQIPKSVNIKIEIKE